MAVQKGLARVGLAKQSVKGTPIANPVYAFGVRAGSTFAIDVGQDVEDRTTFDSLITPGVNRTLVVPGLDCETRAFPGMIGLLLFAALGGQTVSGAGPFIHTLTPATALPYLTAFGEYGGSAVECESIADCIVDELSISWEGAGPIAVKFSLKGITPTWPGTFGTITTDESLASYMRAGGGLFKIDAGSATAVTAPVRAGTLTIKNNVDVQDQSVSVLPTDVVPAKQEITLSLTLTPATNFAEWRKVVTGTGTGTTVSQAPVMGSFDEKVVIDANTDLDMAATNVAFVGDFPDVDPGGGAAELVLEGTVVRPSAGGAAFTAIVRNNIAGTY